MTATITDASAIQRTAASIEPNISAATRTATAITAIAIPTMSSLNRCQMVKGGDVPGGPMGGREEITICILRFIAPNYYTATSAQNQDIAFGRVFLPSRRFWASPYREQCQSAGPTSQDRGLARTCAPSRQTCFRRMREYGGSSGPPGLRPGRPCDQPQRTDAAVPESGHVPSNSQSRRT